MTLSLRRLAPLPLLLGLCTPALADDSGLYVSLLGGANWVAHQNLRQNSLDFVQMDYEQPLSSGYAVDLAVGWRSPSACARSWRWPTGATAWTSSPTACTKAAARSTARARRPAAA